jgi:DNA invertase Pin-like site-specific DNA recombinase
MNERDRKNQGARVALYARVSHSNGDQSPEAQLRELRAYAKLRGWRVVKEYVDQISSTKDNRPQLQAMRWAAKRREFDIVACWKYDRIARDAIQLLTVVDELKALGIAFVSKTQQIDTTTPAGYMVVTVLAGVGKLEREHITERIRAGIAKAREQGTRSGKPIGRPPANKVKVSEVKRLYARLKSCRKVSNKLGIGAMTVQRLVK